MGLASQPYDTWPHQGDLTIKKRETSSYPYLSLKTKSCHNANFIFTGGTGCCHILLNDVIKWKRFPRYCTFVRRIHRPPVNSPHKGQWCGALMLSFICAWINAWVNNRQAGDLRRHRAHHYVIVMENWELPWWHDVLLSLRHRMLS